MRGQDHPYLQHLDVSPVLAQTPADRVVAGWDRANEILKDAGDEI